MIKKKFCEGVMDTKLFICIGGNEDIVDDPPIRTYGEYIDEDRSIVFNMDEIKTKTIFMRTFAHELLHFVSHDLRRKGIEHVFLTEEIYCYLYDNYFGKIWERLQKEQIMKNLR